MLDPDYIVLCEHAYEPDQCPVCGRAAPDPLPAFDVHRWMQEQLEAARLGEASVLAGVPFS